MLLRPNPSFKIMRVYMLLMCGGFALAHIQYIMVTLTRRECNLKHPSLGVGLKEETDKETPEGD